MSTENRNQRQSLSERSSQNVKSSFSKSAVKSIEETANKGKK